MKIICVTGACGAGKSTMQLESGKLSHEETADRIAEFARKI